MAEYDNTLIPYSEDGDEIEFQIVDRIPYNGEEYLVLWDEESDEMAVVVERETTKLWTMKMHLNMSKRHFQVEWKVSWMKQMLLRLNLTLW